MDINIKNLAYQLVPPHKRLPVRIKWLNALFSPLSELWDSFYIWRANTRMMVNVNSQIKVLEGYLRKKYNEPVAIRIESYTDGLIWVALENESDDGAMFAYVGLQDEPEGLKDFPLEGELRTLFADADFIVYIPNENRVERELIEAEIERYRQALVKYKIIQA